MLSAVIEEAITDVADNECREHLSALNFEGCDEFVAKGLGFWLMLCP